LHQAPFDEWRLGFIGHFLGPRLPSGASEQAHLGSIIAGQRRMPYRVQSPSTTAVSPWWRLSPMRCSAGGNETARDAIGGFLGIGTKYVVVPFSSLQCRRRRSCCPAQRRTHSRHSRNSNTRAELGPSRNNGIRRCARRNPPRRRLVIQRVWRQRCRYFRRWRRFLGGRFVRLHAQRNALAALQLRRLPGLSGHLESAPCPEMRPHYSASARAAPVAASL
jgi:hypothetical protein